MSKFVAMFRRFFRRRFNPASLPMLVVPLALFASGCVTRQYARRCYAEGRLDGQTLANQRAAEQVRDDLKRLRRAFAEMDRSVRETFKACGCAP